MAGSSEPVGLSPTERAFLRALQSQGVPFMMVGIAAARLQGAPVVTEDIDLWFAEDTQTGIAAAAEEAGVVYIPGGIAMNPPTFGGRDVRVDQVLTMSGLASFDEELANTIVREVNGIRLRILNLERIIASKRAANRDKDRAVLPALEAALVALRSRERKP
jgi:predicted nucleotidyltransferase